jgi:hypothetical protein
MPNESEQVVLVLPGETRVLLLSPSPLTGALGVIRLSGRASRGDCFDGRTGICRGNLGEHEEDG